MRVGKHPPRPGAIGARFNDAESEWRIWTGGSVELDGADVVRKHPGHPDQKVHGRRGPRVGVVTGLSSGAGRYDAIGGRIAAGGFNGQAVETAVVLGPGGEVLLEKQGTFDGVDFTDAERAMMKDADLVHSHPSGSPLSPQDLQFAAQNDLASIHAYGTDPDGTRIHSALYRPDTGWPPHWESDVRYADHEVRQRNELAIANVYTGGKQYANAEEAKAAYFAEIDRAQRTHARDVITLALKEQQDRLDSWRYTQSGPPPELGQPPRYEEREW